MNPFKDTHTKVPTGKGAENNNDIHRRSPPVDAKSHPHRCSLTPPVLRHSAFAHHHALGQYSSEVSVSSLLGSPIDSWEMGNGPGRVEVAIA